MSGGWGITDGLEWSNLLVSGWKKMMLEGVFFSPSVTGPAFIAIELERMKVVSAD